MKRLLILFLIFWLGIFVLSFFIAEADMSIIQRLGYTAVLALVAPSLSLLGGKRQVRTKQKGHGACSDCCLEIHHPLNPKVLYRIEGQKVYKGMDAVPTYEIKGNKIYSCLSSKPAFRIEDSKVYRGMDAVPFLEIKGDKVYHSLRSEVTYEIKTLQKRGM